MGGINSGRRMKLWACERNNPIVEESSILSVFALSRQGVLKDESSGIYRWDTNSFYYWTEGNTITLQYRTGKHDITQSIHIGRIPLHWNNSTWKPCFICPVCKRSVYKLYVAYGYTYHRCRVCYHMGYELQTMHCGGLPYRYTSIHKRIEKQSEKQKMSGGRTPGHRSAKRH